MNRYYQGGGYIPSTSNQMSPMIQQLWQQYGLTGQAGGLSSQDIASQMGERYGISDPSLLKPELFPSLTPEMLQGTQWATYNPFIEHAQKPMLQQLLAGQPKATGLAGSGAAVAGIGQAKDVYGRQVSDVLQNVAGQRAQAEQQAMAIISGYGTTAGSLRG